jgi:formylglycine-generating enzyme required for sulfatase activity
MKPIADVRTMFRIFVVAASLTLLACSNDAGSSVTCRDASPEGRVVVPNLDLVFDTYEATSHQFAQFFQSTGYLMRVERRLLEATFDLLPDEASVPGSAVFTPPPEDGPLNPARWWRFVEGASWKHPEGPGSNIAGKDDYPVVHIAYEDAVAYAEWVGGRLPNEEK